MCSKHITISLQITVGKKKKKKRNLDLSKRYSDEKKSHCEQKSFYLVTTQSNPDSAPDLKNDIPISKNWKVAEKAGTLCFGLKQLWAPHKLEDKNWFSFLDYQDMGASRSGNLPLSWPCELDCSQICSILKRIGWVGGEKSRKGDKILWHILCPAISKSLPLFHFLIFIIQPIAKCVLLKDSPVPINGQIW